MRVVGPVLVGDEEHARGHARARHDRSVVAGAARHRKVRNAVILRGLDETVEEGIVAPLAVAKYLKDTNRVPEQDFCIVAFRMEECPEFGRAYAGSLALTGQLKPFELELPHRDSGRLLKDVLLERGVDVERIASGEPLIDLSKIAAFVELHIEQGPRLDKEPVNRAAVVTESAGI